ncbi:hypothetical protein GHT06_015106 [Daphnia sinensis]|uniref:Uncharacterized protein n=1 Tax=Daphnia sinensis TaxID=1820382 RepID=A0AAD5L9U5_9CRUS|nr:hypothetical protein GHT06_015106 [Daphnia sinensis]
MLPGAKNGVTSTAANTGDCHIPLRNYRQPRALCLYTLGFIWHKSCSLSSPVGGCCNWKA